LEFSQIFFEFFLQKLIQYSLKHFGVFNNLSASGCSSKSSNPFLDIFISPENFCLTNSPWEEYFEISLSCGKEMNKSVFSEIVK
jgi:hypothetical protein